MPRLGSKKSRNGCIQCKTRKVKCDEQAPCGSCMKYGQHCSLLQAVSTRAKGSNDSNKTTVAQTASPGSTPGSDHANGNVKAALTTTHGPSIATTDAHWALDLELMHHYTATAYITMPGDAAAVRTWGREVPEHAFKHPFLLHCVLAFSAYHFAHTRPSLRKEFNLHASRHQGAALEGMQQVLRNGITDENCHAACCAASLLVLTAFADSTTTATLSGEEIPINALSNISILLRGMLEILEQTENRVRTGPLKDIFRGCDAAQLPPPILSTLLIQLQRHEDIFGPVRSTVAASAACTLRDLVDFCLRTSPHPALRVACLWLGRVKQGFWDAVSDCHDTAAQDVITIYMTVLQSTAEEWWYLSGWKRTLDA